MYAEEYYNDESCRHYYGLYKIHRCNGAEAAYCGIAHYHHRTNYHGNGIIPAQQAVEQLCDCNKAGSDIWDEEYKNYECTYGFDYLGIVPVPFCKKIGYRNRSKLYAVTAQSFCN